MCQGPDGIVIDWGVHLCTVCLDWWTGRNLDSEEDKRQPNKSLPENMKTDRDQRAEPQGRRLQISTVFIVTCSNKMIPDKHGANPHFKLRMALGASQH